MFVLQLIALSAALVVGAVLLMLGKALWDQRKKDKLTGRRPSASPRD